MGKAIDLTSYFKTHLPLTEYNLLFVRVTNALVRSGITTMDVLCEKSDKQLMRVRNLGPKCYEAAIFMREMYLSEKEHKGATHFFRDG